MIAYKLIKQRKNGTLGPLFIEASRVVRVGVWEEARPVRKKGFAFRPGWHVCAEPKAPHLKMKPDRVWVRVEVGGEITEHQRPESQGGLWYTCEKMKVKSLLPQP